MYEYFACICADINSYSLALLHKLDRILHLHKLDTFEGASNNHIIELCQSLRADANTMINKHHYSEEKRFSAFYHNELDPIDRQLKGCDIGAVYAVPTPENPKLVIRNLTALINDRELAIEAEIVERENSILRQLKTLNIDNLSSELQCVLMAIGIAQNGLHVPPSFHRGIVRY
jgi:hypothetical protein